MEVTKPTEVVEEVIVPIDDIVMEIINPEIEVKEVSKKRKGKLDEIVSAH